MLTFALIWLVAMSFSLFFVFALFSAQGDSIADVQYIEDIETIDGVDVITVESQERDVVSRVMRRHEDHVDINGGKFSVPVRRGLGWVSVGARWDLETENTSEQTK